MLRQACPVCKGLRSQGYEDTDLRLESCSSGLRANVLSIMFLLVYFHN